MYNYYDDLLKKRGTEFYGGRSPVDDQLYGFDTRIPSGQGVPMRQGAMMSSYYRGEPNFSTLNLSPVQKRNIIDQSYIRNNLPVPNRSYSSLGQQMNAMNLPMPSGSGQSATGQKTTTGSPPNWKDNLLNYALSPKGQGMAQGLLEASGYSDMPVSFGQALALGIKRGNEAEAQENKTQIEKDKFNFEKSQATIQNLFTQQGLDLELQKILKPELSSFAKDLIAVGIDPNSEEGRKLLESKINKATNTISIVNPEETNEKIRLEEFRIDGDFLKEEKKFFNSAREINSKLLQMKGLIEEGLETNKFTPWKKTFMAVLNSADFLTQEEKDELGQMENFGAMAAYMAPRMRAIGSGATSDFEVGMFIEAAPALGKSEEGNLRIIAGMQQLNDFNMKKYKAMDRWFRENKSLGINIKKGSKGEGLTFEEYWTEETGDTIFQRYTTEEDFNKLKAEGKVKANQYVIYIDDRRI
jgi:hypothetical protein